MPLQQIKEFANQLVDCGLAQSDEIRGCSEAEIDRLELVLGLKFPEIYRLFMLRMGRSAGRLFRGTDVFYGRVNELREYAIELLAESEVQFSLPKNAHVFYMHQGYVFLYFIADDSDDPAVFQFVEGDKEPKQVDDSFSRFLTRALEESQHMANELDSFRNEHGIKRD